MDNLPTDAGVLMAFFAAYMLFITPIIILIIVAGWRLFTKAGQPGWAVLFVSIIDALRLAKVFRKPPVFGVGILLLGVIFIPVLAFGSAEYDVSGVDETELL